MRNTGGQRDKEEERERECEIERSGVRVKEREAERRFRLVGLVRFVLILVSMFVSICICFSFCFSFSFRLSFGLRGSVCLWVSASVCRLWLYCVCIWGLGLVIFSATRFGLRDGGAAWCNACGGRVSHAGAHCPHLAVAADAKVEQCDRFPLPLSPPIRVCLCRSKGC